MTIAVPASAFAQENRDRAARWQRHLIALAAGWAGLLLIFARDVADLAGIYWNSTTYGHCLFVPPVIAWLVWQRRAELAPIVPSGWWPGLLIVVGGGGLWLLGAAGEAGLLRHAGLVVMLQGAVLAVLGPNVARGLIFPLGYMAFLVPFGASLEGPLQALTVEMVMGLLHLTGVPASVDGVLITIPNGYFEVAEACSGAKFVIAMLAYGALVANVCFLSWKRRAAFFAMALAVPVIANGIRAWGTIYAAWLTSVEAATGVDHIIYGWVFFGAVMAAVLAIGWRWFDRDPDAPWFDARGLDRPPARTMEAPLAAVLALAIAAGFSGWAAAAANRADALPDRIDLPTVAGWARAPIAAGGGWTPNYPGADHFIHGRYRDASGATVDVAIALYARQREGAELVGFGIGPVREEDDWVRVADLPPLAGGAAVRLRAPGPVEREVVTWYRLGDVLTASERRVKFETAWARLLGGPQRAVAITVSAPREGQDSRAAIARFVAAAGPLDQLADRIAGTHR